MEKCSSRALHDLFIELNSIAIHSGVTNVTKVYFVKKRLSFKNH